MKLNLNDFKEAAKTILAALDNKKKDTPLYDETLELQAAGSVLLLNVTNREYFATVKFDLPVEENFHASVNAQLFLNLISKLTSDEVELTIEAQNVKIRGNGTYRLPMIYKEDEMLVLPRIDLGTITHELLVKNQILQSILKFNSKELQRGTIVKECQSYYYVDNKGCITFTSGACVNSFTLSQDIKLMLSEKVVKLFKLFKSEEITLRIGETEAGGLTRTQAEFSAGNVTITTILPVDSQMINQVPVDNIRGLASRQFPYSVNMSKELLLESLNRLMLFNSNKNYGRFTFGNGSLILRDWSNENSEEIRYEEPCVSLGTYEAIINMNNLNLILTGCEEDTVKISFGNHTAFVVSKGHISDIIPEMMVS